MLNIPWHRTAARQVSLQLTSQNLAPIWLPHCPACGPRIEGRKNAFTASRGDKDSKLSCRRCRGGV